ncbi:MAG: hypothetical protein AAFR25_01145, partial [Cyanobacteria bacterium J06629_19]
VASLETSNKTQMTIELPEKLAKELKSYLAENTGDSIESIISEALHVRTFPKDPAEILKLAGVVTQASRGAAEHAEDPSD